MLSLARRRKIWKKLRKIRFLLTQRWKYNRRHKEVIGGRSITVLPQVFCPRICLTGEIFAKALCAEWFSNQSRVLELGTGSGIVAIFAADFAEEVIAIDINPHAVECATLNVKAHDLSSKITVRESDLFDNIKGEKFDVILFNPPFFEEVPRSILDRAWRSTKVADRLAVELGEHLTSHGRLFLFLSSDGPTDIFLVPLRVRGYKISEVFRRDVKSEEFFIFQIEQSTNS